MINVWGAKGRNTASLDREPYFVCSKKRSFKPPMRVDVTPVTNMRSWIHFLMIWFHVYCFADRNKLIKKKRSERCTLGHMMRYSLHFYNYSWFSLLVDRLWYKKAEFSDLALILMHWAIKPCPALMRSRIYFWQFTWAYLLLEIRLAFPHSNITTAFVTNRLYWSFLNRLFCRFTLVYTGNSRNGK